MWRTWIAKLAAHVRRMQRNGGAVKKRGAEAGGRAGAGRQAAAAAAARRAWAARHPRVILAIATPLPSTTTTTIITILTASATLAVPLSHRLRTLSSGCTTPVPGLRAYLGQSALLSDRRCCSLLPHLHNHFCLAPAHVGRIQEPGAAAAAATAAAAVPISSSPHFIPTFHLQPSPHTVSRPALASPRLSAGEVA